jgi:hypothetical protein
MNNNFVIKRGGFGGHSVFVTWPPFACRFFPFLSFVYPRAYHRKINFMKGFM